MGHRLYAGFGKRKGWVSALRDGKSHPRIREASNQMAVPCRKVIPLTTPSLQVVSKEGELQCRGCFHLLNFAASHFGPKGK